MFGIGGWELLVIIAVALLVLGPRRLPAAARAVGKSLQTLRRATIDLRRSIELDPEMEDLPRTLDEISRPIVPTSGLTPAARSRPKPDQDFAAPPPRADEPRRDLPPTGADASEAPWEPAADARRTPARTDEPPPKADGDDHGQGQDPERP